MDDERRKRIALNESVFREVNEQVEALNRNLVALEESEDMSIVCECGEIQCAQRLDVSLGEYERVRSDALLFLVVPGHEIPDVEDVVERSDAYLVVRKRPELIGGKIVTANYPRSR